MPLTELTSSRRGGKVVPTEEERARSRHRGAPVKCFDDAWPRA